MATEAVIGRRGAVRQRLTLLHELHGCPWVPDVKLCLLGWLESCMAGWARARL